VTEGIFAVLYVSIMGLTRFYKTTVFLHLYLQFFYCILKIYSIAQKQFQHCETKGRHVRVQNATEIWRFFRFIKTAAAAILDFQNSNFQQSAASRGSKCVAIRVTNCPGMTGTVPESQVCVPRPAGRSNPEQLSVPE